MREVAGLAREHLDESLPDVYHALIASALSQSPRASADRRTYFRWAGLLPPDPVSSVRALMQHLGVRDKTELERIVKCHREAEQAPPAQVAREAAAILKAYVSNHPDEREGLMREAFGLSQASAGCGPDRWN